MYVKLSALLKDDFFKLLDTFILFCEHILKQIKLL